MTPAPLTPRLDDLIIVYRHPDGDETCTRCDATDLPTIALGIKDRGRYCETCATEMAPDPLGELVETLDHLDAIIATTEPALLDTVVGALGMVVAHMVDAHREPVSA